MFRRSQRPTEVRTFKFDFARALETIWQPGEVYTLSDFVRPPTPNGFEYQCTTAGQSAQDEPDWPSTLAGTVIDGSCVWTAVAFATNATDEISSITVSADSGVTVDASSFTADAVLVTLSAITLGAVVDILVTAVTAAGEKHAATLRLTGTE